ncbi:hypothetical protein SUGI_0295470 [Cryptomeria japonica]|nr:hypothetical protein SUGI_0295470 [Cryptomeria japonica]
MVGSGKGGSHKGDDGGKVNALGKNTCEKILQYGHATNKATKNGSGDNASSHRLIVKPPNPGQNPAPSANGGTTEDMVFSTSRGSSPITSDRHETNNVKTKVKVEVCHAEISRACEKIQTVVSGRSRAHVSKDICRDEGAMKLLENVTACESSTDEQGFHGNSTRQEFKTVGGSLAKPTIKCSIDGLNSQAIDDEDDKSTMDTKWSSASPLCWTLVNGV